jgi:hypothetical protein
MGSAGRFGAGRITEMRDFTLIKRLLLRVPVRAALIAALFVGALALDSLAAGAQGYGGAPGAGGGAGGRPGSSGGNNPPLARNVLDPHTEVLLKALDPNNPIAVILAAQKDLKLSDSEMTVLYRIHDSMVQQQAPARVALDTLGPNPSMKSIDLAHLTTEGRDSLIAHRKAVAAANGEIHDAARVAQERALALLTPDQQKQLLDLESHLRQVRDTPHDTGTDEYTKPGSSH